LRKFVNNGQLVGGGTPILQTNGAGNADWILKVGVSDKEWSLINVGDNAAISADALKGKILTSKVVRKSEGADPYSGSFTIELKVEKAVAKYLAAGMFGNATITTTDKVQLWSIPYESLLDANGNKAFVFVTNDNKTAKKITISIFRIESDFVLINSGLENYTSLIVSGNAYLNDNSTIKVEN
jgi:multidrug efflux pump subunit AcrA (membrane-fusion protein)